MAVSRSDSVICARLLLPVTRFSTALERWYGPGPATPRRKPVRPASSSTAALARIAVLEHRLEELARPPKTPSNSRLPPSSAHKPNRPPSGEARRRGRPGKARALRPNPDRIGSAVLLNTSALMGPPSLWDGRIPLARGGGMAAVETPTVTRWFPAEVHRTKPGVVDRMRPAIRSTPLEGYVGCCAAIPRHGSAARRSGPSRVRHWSSSAPTTSRQRQRWDGRSTTRSPGRA